MKLSTLKAALAAAFVGIGLTCAAQNSLTIPPLLTGNVFNLTMQNGSKSFFGSTFPTMGFNGSILGPTLELQAGQVVKLRVRNNLGEESTVHWHGLHVSPENDGGPHTVIGPGETWEPTFTVLNKAATYWYHPHLHHATTEHVLKGLAGMIIVRDAQEAALNLPRTYGVDDFPLAIQTKSMNFVADTIRYGISSSSKLNKDSIVMVNATVDPMLTVPQQFVRLRILNGSQQRVFNLGLSNNGTFYQIASDEGLLSARALKNRVLVAPGERVEILVDFDNYGFGQTVSLMSYGSQLRRGIYGAALPSGPPVAAFPDYNPNPLNGADFEVLQFNVVPATTTPVPVTFATLPNALATVTPYSAASATVTRHKYFSSSGGGVRIGSSSQANQNPQFNENFTADTVQLGTSEIWVLHGDTAQYHPFHIHDVHFFILDRKDSTQAAVPPSPGEAGLKDVVLINRKETVRIIMKFEDFTSEMPYVYHCHITPHEDQGMMQSFVVRDHIYVDKNYTGALEFGSFNFPYDTFAEAVAAAEDGSTIVFKSNGSHDYTYPPHITISGKRIRIKLTTGAVLIE